MNRVTYRRAQQRQLVEAFDSTWRRIETHLTEDRELRANESREVLDRFASEVSTATIKLTDATASIREQMAAIEKQTELLARVVEQEEQLAGLQGRLTDNLDALRTAETLQETLHSLNAAVHLLTARVRPHAA
ncbi:MAG: hypothetical protein R3B90_07295 [Planctomycetaceae bacterium]